MSSDVKVLYEDKYLMVCVKPAGMPTQTSYIDKPDLVSLMRKRRVQREENHYIGLVHRLDQPVEGIIILAKAQFAAKELSWQLNRGTMKKYYLAAAKGTIEEKEGRWEDYLAKDRKGNKSRVVDKGEEGAKEALLNYRVVQEREGFSLLEISIETGRHHQIRVQTSHRGLPLLGDVKYNPDYQHQKPSGYLALCAYRVEFIHPKSKEKMSFEIKPSGVYFQGIT